MPSFATWCLAACLATFTLIGGRVVFAAPNIVTVALGDVNSFLVATAWLDEVLPDQEIQTRLTPNLSRLSDSAVTFRAAIVDRDPLRIDDGAASLRTRGEYKVSPVTAQPPRVSSRDDLKTWSIAGKRQRRWIERTPTSGRGRRAADDLSIEAWERLVDAQEPCVLAANAAAAIRQAGGASPRALYVELDAGRPTPVIPSVFLDRFPRGAIRVPADTAARRALAARLGYDGDPAELFDDRKALIDATRAWFAAASFLDYAVEPILEALAEVNGDDDRANDWVLLLVAPPPEGRDLTTECGSRAAFYLSGHATAQAGRVVATPFGLSGLGRTVIDLAGMDSEGLDADSRTDRDTLSGHSALSLIACERYADVVVTRREDSWSIRSSRFRLVHQPGVAQRLYDLESDPEGVVDLLGAPSEAVTAALGEQQLEHVRAWLTGKLLFRLRSQNDEEKEVAAAIASLEAADAAAIEDDRSPLPGDFNRDGVVDAVDKSLFRDTQGDVGPVGSGADADFDGRVEDGDGEIWRANYGRRAS